MSAVSLDRRSVVTGIGALLTGPAFPAMDLPLPAAPVAQVKQLSDWGHAPIDFSGYYGPTLGSWSHRVKAHELLPSLDKVGESINSGHLLRSLIAAGEPTDLPDIWIGDVTANVTIIEYASLTDPRCARFHEEVLPELRKRYIDTGKVRFALREYAECPQSLAAFLVARAAGADKRDVYLETFFKTAGQWAAFTRSLDILPTITDGLGMERDELDAALYNETLITGICQVRSRARTVLGVNSTPTFFVGTERLVGAQPLAIFEAAIAAQG